MENLTWYYRSLNHLQGGPNSLSSIISARSSISYFTWSITGAHFTTYFHAQSVSLNSTLIMQFGTDIFIWHGTVCVRNFEVKTIL